MVGRRVLVRVFLTSKAIFHITSIDLPKEVLKSIISLLRVYLWPREGKETGGKGKVNWDKKYRPAKLGGLCILYLYHFVVPLWIRYLWYEWVDDTKTWIGLGHPCNQND
jgi:hypothetical protein